MNKKMNITLISTSTSASDQGLRTISSVLKSKGHETKVLFLTASEDYSQFYKKETLEQIKDLCKDSELIGISSMTSTSKRAIQVIEFLKQLKIPIMWGGVHATLAPQECIKYVDLVCVGEGEETIIEVVNNLNKNRPLNKIANLWVKKDNKIIKNKPRQLIPNLDSLPMPDYIIENHYILKNNKLIKFTETDFNGYIFFLTGRGCPYCCTYCSNKAFNNLYENKWSRLRWHSPEYIINGILDIKNKYPTLKIFDIRDDTFSVRPLEQIKKFCQLYKEKINMRMKCLGDPKTINEEKLKLLIDAGCTDIIIGIQGQERVNLEVYHRPQRDSQIINVAKILNKFKDQITVMYDIITTNPYEKREDILNLINLLENIPPPFYLSVNNLVFFTGSELYNQAVKDGIIKNEKDSAIDLNYWDRWKHIKLKKKNMYLNLMLNLMRGSVTSFRFGLMPKRLIKILTKKEIVKFNEDYTFPTYILGTLVGTSDIAREKIIKPIYHSLPLDFKVWYDKVRYKI